MEYRAIVVDDEYWALESMKRIFPWAKYGFEVSGTFMDGGEALKYILENPVDLVVTDIRMPEFSGLEMLGAYRAAGGEAEFIIISGYSEFEYARAALHDNAFDYCLKPIKAQEAEEVLGRVREACRSRRERQDRVLLDGLEEKDGCARVFERRGVPLKYGALLCAVTARGALDESALSALDYVCVGAGQGKWVYLFCADEDALEQTARALEQASGAGDMCVGVSRIACPDQAGAAWVREADIASFCYFVAPEKRFERFNPLPNPAVNAAVRAFSLAVGNRDGKLVNQVSLGAAALLQRENLGMFHAQNLYNRLVISAQNQLGDSAVLEVCGYEELAERYFSAAQMFESLAADVCVLMQSAAQPSAAAGGDSFRQLLDYVRENYTRKLSVRELADKFYMNTTYLCELFKRKTGHTFNEYVTALRMQRAGDLIGRGEQPLQEIAYQVGYSDYFYFSKAFKKYFALSPSAYAQKARAGE